METTMNNLFKNAMRNSIKTEMEKRAEKMRKEIEFLEDMKVIKKNLEDAFAGFPIRVEMGMFGMQEVKYTTIRVVTNHGTYSGITSNNALWKCMNWDYKSEEKDFRKDGQPMTYERLFEVISNRLSKYV